MAKFEELRYVVKVDDQGTFVIDELNVKTKSVKQTFDALSKSMLSTDALKKKLNATDRVSIKELQELRLSLIQNRDAMALTSKEYSKFTQKIDAVNVRINEFKTQARGITKVNGDMQSSAGLAGAATIELGRVFSDAGYGIRGIANNIQQLASLFITLSVSAGGAGKAISLIGKQLRGPLGILVLFQGLISLIEFLDRKYKIFSSSASEATKALEKQRETLAGGEGNIALLQAYADIIEDSNSSVDAQAIALQKLKKQGYDPTIGSIKEFIEAQSRLMLIDVAEDVFKDSIKSLIEERLMIDEEIKEINKTLEERAAAQEARMSDPEAGGFAVSDVGLVERELEEREDELDERKKELANMFEEKSRDFQKTIEDLKASNPFLNMLLGGKPPKPEDEPIDPISLQYQIDLLLNKGVVDPELEDFLKLFDELIEAQELIDKTSEAAAKVRVVDMDDVAFEEYAAFISQFPDVAGKTQEQLIEIEKEGALTRLDEIYKFRGEDIENNILYQEDRLRIEKFYNGKIEESRKEHFDKIRKRVKEASSSIQSIVQDVIELRRANSEREIAIIESKTNKLLSQEGLSEERRIKIIQDAEDKKQKINEEAIKFEMKMTRLKFAIKGAELAANIAADFAQGIISLKIGKANTAKNGFPQNIPLLLAYGAQAAAIISGMKQAKSQADTALANLGASRVSTPTPSSEQIAAPQFNVVGQSQASQLSETIAGAFGEPVKAYVVSTEIADSLAFQRKIDRQSGFGAGGFGAGS